MAKLETVRKLLLSLQHLPNAPDMRNADTMVRRYHEVLSQWPDDILEIAGLHYRGTQTFFPSEGDLNNKVLDLQMITMGIPTAAEAWSQVLGAIKFFPTTLCETGIQLMQSVDGKLGGEYFNAVHDYGNHKTECPNCESGGYRETYSHSVVEETVKLLGGRDKLFTDNPAADRKQFIDAYRERVTLEGRKYIMPATVKIHIEQQKEIHAGDKIKQLAKGMSK